MSRLDNAIDKVVISDSLTTEETSPWQESTRIISRADAHQQIAKLKGETGREILIFGSHTLDRRNADRHVTDERDGGS